MAALRFEWDPRKAAANLAKHGIAFSDAVTAFGDEMGLVLDDPDHSADEKRFVLLGADSDANILVVVHCLRESGSTIRIISARRANRPERGEYQRRNR